MDDKIFGEVSFKAGWKKDDTICLWGNNYNIVVTAAAYYEDEYITEKQQLAYQSFNMEKSEITKKIEQLLDSFMNEAEKHLTPRFLVFEKNGAYALMFDDDTDPDDGIAVQLSPDEKVMSQDAYL